MPERQAPRWQVVVACLASPETRKSRNGSALAFVIASFFQAYRPPVWKSRNDSLSSYSP